MSTILIGYDGSDGARRAIAFAGEYFPGRKTVVVAAAEAWPPARRGADVHVDEATQSAVEATADEGALAAAQAGLDQLAHHAHQPVIAVPTPQAVAARREQKQSGAAGVR